MSSQKCAVEGCEEPTKGRYCPEHEAGYLDYLADQMYDSYLEEEMD